MPTALLLALLSLVPQAADAEAWTEDTLHLVEAIPEMHPKWDFACAREDFEAAVDAYLSSLDDASEDQALVGFMGLVARLFGHGRDGHSMVWPMGGHFLPLQLYSFSDGWFVVAADEAHRDWIGAEVQAIGGEPVARAVERVAPLLTRDNEWNLRQKLGAALACTEILHGVGLGEDSTHARFRLARAGKTEELTLEGMRGAGHRAVAPLPQAPEAAAEWLAGHERAWRMKVLAAERALYVQYNEVTAQDASGETLAAFAAEVVRTFEEQGLARLIVDVRSNGGGNNTTFGPLIAALQSPAVERPGVLFGLIGRATFSAAGNFVTVLQRDTKALLIGEPTGGAPNQYGDAREVALPRHPDLLVRVSTRYHEFSSPDDPRLTHEPHLMVPLRSSDWLAGRDPVLRAALDYQPPK